MQPAVGAILDNVLAYGLFIQIFYDACAVPGSWDTVIAEIIMVLVVVFAFAAMIPRLPSEKPSPDKMTRATCVHSNAGCSTTLKWIKFSSSK